MVDAIPVFSLSKMHAEVDVGRAIARVVARGRFILGPEVERFEECFADHCGVQQCVGVANGTDALEIALRALDIGPGNRVAMTANAASYASSAARAVGASPSWVDVDAETMTMSPDHLGEVLTGETAEVAAVIVTHLYGRLAHIEAINAIAERAGVPVIEDCAQSHGARRGGRAAGSFGSLGCFSFYPTKNLGALGDGGAIVTNDIELAHRVRSLRQYGWVSKYRVGMRGGRNSRLDELQAAVLLEKLPRLDLWNDERRAIARRYSEGLVDLDVRAPDAIDEGYVAHLYVIRHEDRDALARHLLDSGVQTDVHYPVSDHHHAAIDDGGPIPSLLVTEEACATVLTLPCYPGLLREDQDVVIDAVRSFAAVRGS